MSLRCYPHENLKHMYLDYCIDLDFPQYYLLDVKMESQDLFVCNGYIHVKMHIQNHFVEYSCLNKLNI